jgi:hypothetical protein
MDHYQENVPSELYLRDEPKIPQEFKDAYFNRRLMTQAQLNELRQLYKGKFPVDIVPRLDARHKDALTEDQATKLLAELRAAADSDLNALGKPAPAVARVPATATSTLHEVLAGSGDPGDVQGLATTEQRNMIISLLNHPRIARSEKTKFLLNINVYDEQAAERIIGKLRTMIEERQQRKQAA